MRTLQPSTLRLLCFLGLALIGLNVILFLLPWTPSAKRSWDRTTNLQYAVKAATFWTRRFGSDSWEPMIAASELHRSDPNARIYKDAFFDKGIKFQYPPSSLLITDAATALVGTGPWEPLRGPEDRRLALLNFMCWFFLLSTAWCSAQIFLLSLERAGLGTTGWDRRARWLTVFVATFFFYPVVRSFSQGQVQTIINAGWTLSILLWMRGNRIGVGAICAALCAMKPQYGALLLWAAVRKEWRMLLTTIAVGGVLLLISLWVYGLQNHLDYLEVLSHLSRHGESFYPNQSMNGLLHRLLGNGNNTFWLGDQFPPFHPVVYALTLATSIPLLLSAVFLGRSGNQTAREASLLIALLSCTMASPIAWEHHYGVLLPIFAWLTPQVMAASTERRWPLWVLGACFVLSATFFGLAIHFGESRALTPLQSTLYFGAVGVLGLLWWVQRQAVSGSAKR